MAIRFNSSESFNNFFNTSLGRNTTRVSNDLLSTINLSDYKSIKTGTYGRLVDTYYEKNEIKGKESSKKDVIKEEMSKESSKISTSIIENSNDANKSLDYLAEVTYEEKNREKIMDNVKKFVTLYNDILEGVEKSENKDVETRGNWMEQMTKVYEKSLNEIGISSDNSRLSLDNDKLKNAKLDKLEDLFVGKSSFGKNIRTKIEQISSSALSVSKSSYNGNGSVIGNITISNIDTYL